uniref:Si:ch211-214e3.5 n=1 Tax=Cyprinodon variegatus TaxID=28743 RepID=A0A3Q2DZL0_CYPVA
MEQFTLPQDAHKNHSPSVGDVEKEEVNDLVYKHLKEANNGPLFNNADNSVSRENGSVTKNDGQTVRGHCKSQQRAVFSGKILSFGCSLCKDNLTFSPNDLLKHFQGAHKGSLPAYPCDLCDFVTNEFSALQRHRIEHRNTLVTCELCNDNVQYSLLLLTRHYMNCHSKDGEFQCDWCKFTTVDAGTFVQHIHHHNESHWKCSKCRHISLNEEDHQTHMKAHSGTFTFTCKICGFGTEEIEHLKKHKAAVHKEEAKRKNALKAIEDCSSPGNSSTNLTLVTKQELPLEEIHHLIEGGVGQKDHKGWSFHNADNSTPVMLQESENTSETGSFPNANGLTVLMVKNKISLPPNCTTKVMGFKMVDGKKHLVLKVIPARSEGKGSTSQCLSVSPRNGSCHQADQDDIMAKVKIEEEETSVSSLNSTPHSRKQENEMYPVTIQATHSRFEPVSMEKGKLPVAHNSDTAKLKCDGGSYETEISKTKTVCEEVIAHPSTLNTVQRTLLPQTVFRETVEFSRAKDESLLTDGFRVLCKKYKADSVNNTLYTHSSSQVTSENDDCSCTENRSKNSLQTARKPESPSHLSPNVFVDGRRDALGTEKGEQKTPNQEVFTFHNYSKEICRSSPNNVQNLSCIGEDLEHQGNASEASQFRLRLSESPDAATASIDGDIEVDGCVGSNDLLTEENSDSVLRDLNIVKIEEECVPISTRQPDSNTSLHSMESFVKEHSNAIITKQLNKNSTGSSNSSNAHLTKAKKTLQILQLPGGKPPVFLRATENKIAMPVQTSTGFKVLTSSSNPQISLSYTNRELNNSTASVTLTPKANIVGVAAGKPQATEKGATVLSAVHSGGNATQNQYYINSPGFKGPVLLSRTLNSTPTNMAVKAQPTCYFVQRSVPIVQNPNTTSSKVPCPQVPVNPKPVLAGTLAEKPGTPQTSRQAYLLRYISPTKSGLFVNKEELKNRTVWSQASECSGNKVIFKIVSPTARLNTAAAPTSSSKPLLLATRPQGQCFLVSANNTVPASCEVKKMVSVQINEREHQKEPIAAPLHVNGNLQLCEANRPLLAPRVVGQRKRHRKALLDELPATLHKARRFSNKVLTEKDPELWTPVGKEVERTLRLTPFSAAQQIKYPCRYQPVVVLNHPDADIPEVTNIMKMVNKHKGAVTKVALNVSRPRPVLSAVRERFLLKLKLRKKNRKKYEVVKTLSSSGQSSVVFDCWFCGRLFNNQEDWIGHGQRHLMEATRDWNKLF